MEIELCPAVSLLFETFNVLVAPSRILSRLNRNITELDVRRAFTSFQLMTILEENTTAS
jgi:hypothetical protein